MSRIIIEDEKESLKNVLESMSEERQKEVMEFYDKSTILGVYNELVQEAKQSARSTIDTAKRRGYGFGECYYYLNEDVKEIAEDLPEVERVFKSLVYSYYEIYVDAEEA